MCPCEIYEGISLNSLYFFLHNKHASVLGKFPFNGKLCKPTSGFSFEKTPHSLNSVELARIYGKSHWLEAQLFHPFDSIAQVSVMVVYDQKWFDTIL
jgi:hypothetical protein